MTRHIAIATATAVFAVIGAVFWLGTYKPAYPGYDEKILTNLQTVMVANLKGSRSVEVLQTHYSKPIYLVMERGKEYQVTFHKPEWVALDGSIVLTEREKRMIVAGGPAQMPTWMFWQVPTATVGLLDLAVMELQGISLLLTVLGAVFGFGTAAEPKLKYLAVGVLICTPLLIAWLRVSGGMSASSLHYGGPTVIGIVIFLVIGWLTYCCGRLLELERTTPTAP